jgi:hypothetical protein
LAIPTGAKEAFTNLKASALGVAAKVDTAAPMANAAMPEMINGSF